MKTTINLLTSLVLALLCINATAQVQAQKPQQAVVSKTLKLTASGTLETLLTAVEKNAITALTLKGDIDQRDFIVMSEKMPALNSIDLSAAVIKAYEQFPENELPRNAFFGMNKLTKIALPENLEAIGYNGFYGCSALKKLTLPNSVKKIGGQAFINCGLKEIYLGESFTTGLGELRECETLEFTMVLNKRYRTFSGLVYNLAGDTLVFCPPAYKTTFGEIELYPNLKVIGKAAFFGCKRLSGQLRLPYNLIEIGESAFYGCTGLTGVVEIPHNVIRIGSSAFAGCGISKIVISELKLLDDPGISGCFIYGDLGCPKEVKKVNSETISSKVLEVLGSVGDGFKGLEKKKVFKKVFEAVISKYGIKSFAVEKNGDLWVTSLDGLAKIENNKVTKCTWQEGLPTKYIDCVTIDPKNTVWVGYFGGIAKISDGKWITVKSPKPIKQIFADSKGNIWAGNRGNELYCYDGKKTKKFKLEKYSYIGRDVALNSKDILFSSDKFFNGLKYFNGEKFIKINYSDDESTYRYILKNHIISDGIYIDDKDQVWICTEGRGRGDNLGGLIKYDGKVWENYLQKENVRSVRQDEKGNYWISTDRGIFKNFEFLSDELKSGILIPCKNNMMWNIDLSGKVTLIELIE